MFRFFSESCKNPAVSDFEESDGVKKSKALCEFGELN